MWLKPNRSLYSGCSTQGIQDPENQADLKSQALIKAVFLLIQLKHILFLNKKGGKTISKKEHLTPVKEQNKLLQHLNKF